MSSGLLAPFLRLEAAMLPRNATLQKLDLGLGAQRLKAAGPAGPAGPRPPASLCPSEAGTPSATPAQSASYPLPSRLHAEEKG